MRILVCGGRDYGAPTDDPELKELRKKQYHHVQTVLDQLLYDPNDEYHMPYKDACIIHGAAKGADTAAWDYTAVHWTDCIPFPADWDRYGKDAGPIRNKQMLDKGKPNLVVAFPGGKGTANMIKQAKEAGIPVLEIESIN